MPRYSSPPPQAPQPPAHQPGRVLRAVALTAVSTGVLILAAAAFVFSYSGIHAVAQQAGISATLARGYPVIFDALLVVACAAVLSLRGAGAVSRFYAWLSLLVLLGATAGADALHSTGTVVPHRAAALVAAIIPWILLLIGFGLLLAMLRHFRLHRAAPAPAAPAPARAPQEARRPAALPPGPTQPTRPPQLPAAAKQANAGPPPGTAAPAPAVPGPAVPVPAAPVPAPAATAPAVPVPAPEAAAPAATVSAPAATAAAPAADRPSPGSRAAADVPPVIVPPQARSEPPHRPQQASGGPAAGPDRTGPDGPAEPDLADVHGHGDSGDRPAGGGDAVAAPEEIFAAPPADAGPADAGPADAGPADAGPGDAAADPGDRAGRAAAPQPAFHRMWSSPTPPGEEDEG